MLYNQQSTLIYQEPVIDFKQLTKENEKVIEEVKKAASKTSAPVIPSTPHEGGMNHEF